MDNMRRATTTVCSVDDVARADRRGPRPDNKYVLARDMAGCDNDENELEPVEAGGIVREHDRENPSKANGHPRNTQALTKLCTPTIMSSKSKAKVPQMSDQG